ncbi:hypothetical protein CMT22_17915 [Elizabethkingia anophelis]|nr:hypothetical protein [Elizabethkingia anophelis]MDV4099103.1 hypothetical protein [Elizabethkingia anophelis]
MKVTIYRAFSIDIIHQGFIENKAEWQGFLFFFCWWEWGSGGKGGGNPASLSPTDKKRGLVGKFFYT